jgi:hypothetical protein
MLDEHLAGDLVLAPLRDGEVDLEEGVRVAVEDGRDSLLLEELDVLEPVQVLARRRGGEVDVLDERDVFLVREAMAREVLGIELDDLLGLAPLGRGAQGRSMPGLCGGGGLVGRQSPAPASSAGCSGR